MPFYALPTAWQSAEIAMSLFEMWINNDFMRAGATCQSSIGRIMGVRTFMKNPFGPTVETTRRDPIGLPPTLDDIRGSLKGKILATAERQSWPSHADILINVANQGVSDE